MPNQDTLPVCKIFIIIHSSYVMAAACTPQDSAASIGQNCNWNYNFGYNQANAWVTGEYYR